MSADNYGIVHRHDGEFGISMFFASDDTIDEHTFHPYFTASTLGEVIEEANKEYFEYGWSFDPALQDWLIDLAENNNRKDNDNG